MYNNQIELFIINENATLIQAMQKIDVNANGILFVVNDDKKLCGAISDGDIRRWILRTGCLEANVQDIMNREPIYLQDEKVDDIQLFMKKKSIVALPILDNKNQIVKIELLKHNNTIENVQNKLEDVSVIIMAGGKGTRLYPYTKILPKPLIPIGDIPILERIVNSFYDYGITDFLFTVNYKKNMIRSYFTELDKKYNIEYIEEEQPLGTAGSICLIERKFSKPVFVTNCDTLIRADYSDIYKYHLESNNAMTMVCALKHDTIPYGVIQTKENGEIKSISEKPSRSYLINTGMYIINPEIIKSIPKNKFFHMTHLMEKVIENNLRVGMYPVSEDSFLDMGEIEEMKRMEEKLNLK